MRVHDPCCTVPPDIIGGRVCLDLANSRQTFGRPEAQENLETYQDVVEWAEQVQIISAKEGRQLRKQAESDPGGAQVALDKARDLRAALCSIFGAVACGSEPDPEAVARLGQFVQEALSRLQLVKTEGGYGWGWLADDDLGRLMWPVARSAADLLVSEELQRVRMCDADNCRWLFVDGSRNGKRRWCDMSVCGNRAKARRHYARSRAKAADRPD